MNMIGILELMYLYIRAFLKQHSSLWNNNHPVTKCVKVEICVTLKCTDDVKIRANRQTWNAPRGAVLNEICGVMCTIKFVQLFLFLNRLKTGLIHATIGWSTIWMCLAFLSLLWNDQSANARKATSNTLQFSNFSRASILPYLYTNFHCFGLSRLVTKLLPSSSCH